MQENKQDKYEFISEKIKEKPVNKKKLVYHVCFVVLLAVLFGIVASVTFVLCQPWSLTVEYQEKYLQVL